MAKDVFQGKKGMRRKKRYFKAKGVYEGKESVKRRVACEGNGYVTEKRG